MHWTGVTKQLPTDFIHFNENAFLSRIAVKWGHFENLIWFSNSAPIDTPRQLFSLIFVTFQFLTILIIALRECGPEGQKLEYDKNWWKYLSGGIFWRWIRKSNLFFKMTPFWLRFWTKMHFHSTEWNLWATAWSHLSSAFTWTPIVPFASTFHFMCKIEAGCSFTWL